MHASRRSFLLATPLAVPLAAGGDCLCSPKAPKSAACRMREALFAVVALAETAAGIHADPYNRTGRKPIKPPKGSVWRDFWELGMKGLGL
jgi:hypothetical protein